MPKAVKTQGESMGIPGQATEAAKSAPKTAPKKARSQGKDMGAGASEEKARMAPEHKGQKNRYGGDMKGDQPSSAPQSHPATFDANKLHLDGHAPKNGSRPTKKSSY
jgi:hypothetical protein